MNIIMKASKRIGIVFCMIVALVVILSSCDKKKSINDMILGTWTLTSNPSCTWTFLRGGGSIDGVSYYGKAIISVDTFPNAMTCLYQLENNTLKLFESYEYELGTNYASYQNLVGFHVAESYLSVDDISKDMLHLSGNIQLYEMIQVKSNHYRRVDHNTIVTVSYEFRKSN